MNIIGGIFVFEYSFGDKDAMNQLKLAVNRGQKQIIDSNIPPVIKRQKRRT